MTTRIERGQVPPILLPHRLQIARDFAGLNQTELADLIGVSRTTVTNAECGQYTPRNVVLHAWALATGVAKWWLLGEELPSAEVKAAEPPAERKTRRGTPIRPRGLAVDMLAPRRDDSGPAADLLPEVLSKHNGAVQQTPSSFAYAQKPVGWAESCVTLPAGISRGEKVA